MSKHLKGTSGVVCPVCESLTFLAQKLWSIKHIYRRLKSPTLFGSTCTKEEKTQPKAANFQVFTNREQDFEGSKEKVMINQRSVSSWRFACGYVFQFQHCCWMKKCDLELGLQHWFLSPDFSIFGLKNLCDRKRQVAWIKIDFQTVFYPTENFWCFRFPNLIISCNLSISIQQLWQSIIFISSGNKT